MQRFWHSFLGPRPQLTSCRYPTSPCHTCWRTSGPSWSKSSLDWCTLSQLQLFLKQLSCCVRYEYDPKHIMTIIIFGTQLWTNSFNLEHPGFSLLLNFSHLETESSNSRIIGSTNLALFSFTASTSFAEVRASKPVSYSYEIIFMYKLTIWNVLLHVWTTNKWKQESAAKLEICYSQTEPNPLSAFNQY